MNKKFLTVYTVFASLVFVFSILFFSFNIYKDYNKGKDDAAYRFFTISNNISKAAKKNLSSLNNVENYIPDFNDISSIKITINGNIFYSYPTNNYSNENSKYIRNFTSKIDTNDGNIKIDANIYTLKPISIFYYARISFLIVLIITLITIIMLISLNYQEKKLVAQPSEEDNLDINENNNESNDDDSVYKIDEEIIDEEDIVFDETPFELMEKETAVSDAEVSSDNEETVDEPSYEEEVKLPYEEYIPDSIENNGLDIFSPENGISWETYLKERLDNEINTAISSEIDLSLFILQIPDVPRESETFKNICNYLTIQFIPKNLIFEYKEDCIVAIKNSMNLDDALNLADKLYADIKNLIDDKECFIGISTKSIRIVSSERILMEAEEALKHAKEDPESPIIAFRVDANKYREYMEKTNNN